MSRNALPGPSRPALAATLVLISAGLASRGSAAPRPGARAPADLLAALSAKERRLLVEEAAVVTLPHERQDTESGVRLSAVSVAVLLHAPEAARGLLDRIQEYGGWVPLNPSYKEVRVLGPHRIACETGRSESPRSKDTLVYDVEHAPRGTRWTVVSSSSPLRAGSAVAFEVAPHPDRPSWSVVVHRQTALLPPKGRMTRYLVGVDDEGRNRYWKDANKHARRMHWAMDAALSHPDGAERRAAYLEAYVRGSRGRVPYWAK